MGFGLAQSSLTDRATVIDLQHKFKDDEFFLDQDYNYTSLSTSSVDEYAGLSKFLTETYKGIPAHDSIQFSCVLKDVFFIHDLNKFGDISDETLKDVISRQTNDTLNYSKIKLRSTLFVVTGFVDKKEFLIADTNHNFDFSDDYRYDYDKDFRLSPYKNISLLKDQTSTNYSYEYCLDGKVTKVDRKFILYPDRNNPASLSGQNPYKEREYFSILKLRDYWEGEAVLDNKTFKFYYHGYSNKFGALYVVPKGLPYRRNSDTYENRYRYRYFSNNKFDDTLSINGYRYKIDSIDSKISKLYIRKLKEVPQYGYHEGQQISQFDLPDLKGNNLNINDILSIKKYTLIDFWGTWCEPCIKFTPKLKLLLEKYSSKLTILGVAVDDDPKKASNYLSKKGAKWESLFIPRTRNWSHPVIKQLKIASFPTFLLVASNGEILIRGNSDAFEEISTYLANE